MRFIIIVHVEWMITSGKTNLDDLMLPCTNAGEHVICNDMIRLLDKVGPSLSFHLSVGEKENKRASQWLYFKVHANHFKAKDEGSSFPS